MKKIFKMFIVITAISIVSACSSVSVGEPKSAEGMSVNERAEHDGAVIKKELEKLDFEVDHVKVNYKMDAITVQIKEKSTDQYAEETADEILSNMDDVLSSNQTELTLEKDDYMYFVYGSDGKPAIW